MSYELTIVTALQYVVHYVADIIHNFPDFLSFLNWGQNAIVNLLGVFPAVLGHLAFFGISTRFLIRLVKF